MPTCLRTFLFFCTSTTTHLGCLNSLTEYSAWGGLKGGSEGERRGGERRGGEGEGRGRGGGERGRGGEGRWGK